MVNLIPRIPTGKKSTAAEVWKEVSEAVSYMMEGQKEVKSLVGFHYEHAEQIVLAKRKLADSFWYLYEEPILRKLKRVKQVRLTMVNTAGKVAESETIVFNIKAGMILTSGANGEAHEGSDGFVAVDLGE